LKARLEELGYHLSEEKLAKTYKLFTELADRKKEVFDDDLRSLMGDEIFQDNENLGLEYLQVLLGTQTIPTATVKIKHNEQVLQESATGDGPVDAVYNAIDRALKTTYKIESYQVRSVTSGRQAMGEVLLRIRDNGDSFHGRGVSTDIVEASAKAYLQAIRNLQQSKSEKYVTEIQLNAE